MSHGPVRAEIFHGELEPERVDVVHHLVGHGGRPQPNILGVEGMPRILSRPIAGDHPRSRRPTSGGRLGLFRGDLHDAGKPRRESRVHGLPVAGPRRKAAHLRVGPVVELGVCARDLAFRFVQPRDHRHALAGLVV